MALKAFPFSFFNLALCLVRQPRLCWLKGKSKLNQNFIRQGQVCFYYRIERCHTLLTQLFFLLFHCPFPVTLTRLLSLSLPNYRHSSFPFAPVFGLQFPGRTQMRQILSQPRRPMSNVPKWSSLSMRSVSPGILTPQRRKKRKRRRKRTRLKKNTEAQVEQWISGSAGQGIDYVLVNCFPGN